jgi:hypothetical protein
LLRRATQGCGEAAAQWTPKKNGREAVALLAALKREFACSVRWLSCRIAISKIDLAARN